MRRKLHHCSRHFNEQNNAVLALNGEDGRVNITPNVPIGAKVVHLVHLIEIDGDGSSADI
jgi:hypothetical protein